MDRRVPGHRAVHPTVLYCFAHARGGRQDVREINGVCAGLYHTTVRVSATGGVQPDPHLFGRGLHVS